MSMAGGTVMTPLSALCLGCMSFGTSAWRPWVLDEAPAFALLDRAVDRGLRAFDTANVYSGGESERILGRYIKSRGLRDTVFIATNSITRRPTGWVFRAWAGTM